MNPNHDQLKEIQEIRTCREGTPDDLFICFASFEERCLGVVRRFYEYAANRAYVLRISDEPSEFRELHLRELKDALSKIAAMTVIETQHKDPIVGMRTISKLISDAALEPGQAAITLDISTFTKKQLLLILRLFDQMGLFESLRILYTEPLEYMINLDQPLSSGLKEVTVVPTFTGRYDSQNELILVIFLGYEGDRALALLENVEPHKTIAVIPSPAYHPEWEGKTEEMNAALLVALDSKNICYVDSRDPFATASLLDNLINPRNETQRCNWYIAPLGTKLQTLGVYYFISKHPDVASIIYAKPLEHNEPYFSEGIGRTWLVPGREN